MINESEQNSLSHFYDAHPREYGELLKPRVMSLAIFTAWCGMMLVPKHKHPLLMIFSLICIAAGAGAAGCLNMYFEKQKDALMNRTKHRPLPSGRIHPQSALTLGIILSFFSTVLLGLVANWNASFLLAMTILLYVGFYTLWLKPRTPQNIVWGGISGALPPLIGWSCFDHPFSILPWLLVLIIFFWTPPHFWALCLESFDDYEKAGFPMFPCFYGVEKTKKNIFAYTVTTVFVSFLVPYSLSQSNRLVCIVSISILGFIFIHYSLMLLKKDNFEKKVFLYSIIYLFLLFIVFVVFQ